MIRTGVRWYLVGFVALIGVLSVRAGELINLYMAKPDILVIHFLGIPTRSFNPAPAFVAGNYSISSTDDAGYSAAKTPLQGAKKGKALHVGAYTVTQSTREYWASLKLPSALQSGKRYTLTAQGNAASLVGFADTTFVFDERELYSEAIHVNSIGFLSDASMKYGYVSHYLGEMGDISYSNNMKFHLMDVQSKAYVLSGTLNQTGWGDDHYKTPVWQCDFSAATTPGTYKLVVEGVGSSFPFEIGIDGYREAFQAVSRGLFHQRCSMEFTAEHTKWVKPRCHHSDDIPAYQSNSGFVNDDPPALKAAGTTGERIDCWGGWHDAGDNDHYESHMKIPYMLYAAYELNPSGHGDGKLRIPEGGNGIPDIIDEARWGVDLWKRMQKSDGKVPPYTTPYPDPGGFADQTNPEMKTTAIYASAPTASAGLQYSGMAAAMGYFLKKSGKNTEASQYISSAEKSYAVGGSGIEKAAAALWLWRATGNANYHNDFKNNRPGLPGRHGETDDLATYVIANYVLAPPSERDQGVYDDYKNAIVSSAEQHISAIDNDAMRAFRKGDWLGGSTTPATMTLALAYKLTDNKRYRDYHALECDYFLGGNPLNMTWITGIGGKTATDLLHVEASFRFAPMGLPVPEGLVPYGPTAYYHSEELWCSKNAPAHQTLEPTMSEWSLAEAWFEWPGIVCANEYTVHQTQGPAIFAYAGLLDNQVSRTWPDPQATVAVVEPASAAASAMPRTLSISRQATAVQLEAPVVSRVAVYDMTGRRLLQTPAQKQHAIELKGYGPGVYILKVTGAGLNRSIPVITER